MTVGLPGTGIGGLFYLLGTFAMPLREGYRWARRGRGGSGNGGAAPGWRTVAGLTLIAGGILAGIWVTGWLLGVALASAPSVRHLVVPTDAHPHNVVRTAMFAVSLGVLGVVLLGIEVLAWWVRRRPVRASVAGENVPERRRVRRRVAGSRPRASGPGLIMLVVLGALAAGPAVAQHSRLVTRHLARADSAFTAGDPAVAAVEYAAVLAADPDNSHATFRLAQLRRGADRGAALRLFRRYVELEPSDPWGYMAVGDEVAQSGRYDEALRWYDDALRRAPEERDAVVGRARLLARAGRIDAAVAAYERWLAAYPGDSEAWRELARQRQRAGRVGDAVHALEHAQEFDPDPAVARRLAAARGAAAPAFTPLLSGSRDSDGNNTVRFGGAVELAAAGPVRLGLAVSRGLVGDGITTAALADAALRVAWRPRAALQVDAGTGGTHLDAVGGRNATVIPTGRLRLRFRALPTAGGLAAELRAQRSMLDATPLLLANRVVRTELGAMVELPVVRFPKLLRLRGLGRFAALTHAAAVNHRTTVAGGVSLAASPGVELSGQFQQIRYSHQSAAGYFAPRLVQLVEAGSYMEFETSGSVVFALEIGAGVQRLAEHGSRVGVWRGALRLYSLIALPLAPGRDLRLELDGEDSSHAPEAATSAQWRYGSAALSLRWALP